MIALPPLVLRWFERIFPFAVLALLALSAWLQASFSIMGDKGWLMHAANEWLSGKKLYVDLFEVNPPLIVWIYALPAWVARRTLFLSDYAAMGMLGLCVCLASIRLCMRVMARHPVFEGNPRGQAILTLILAVMFILMTSSVFFFDREHIMLVTTFPYLLRFAPSLSRTAFPLRLRLLVGALAAVGFCIKPHAVLVFAGLQLIYLARERSALVLKSAENLVIYALAGLYLAAIFIFTPEYITLILPMAYATYAFFNVKTHTHTHIESVFIAFTMPLLKFNPRYKTPYRSEIYYFILAALVYLVYALTNNGWGYTYYPVSSVLFFMACWLFWEYGWLKREHAVRDLDTDAFENGQRACGIYFLLQAASVFFALKGLLLSYNCGGYNGCEDNAPFVDYIREKHVHSFGLMSGEFTRWPQISSQSEARWNTRFNHLWMVPALVANGKGPTDVQQWIVDEVGGDYASDLDRWKPDIVFVDNSDQFFTSAYHVDLPGLLKPVPAFSKAWSHYRFDKAINHCASNKEDRKTQYYATVGCRYDIYVRISSPAHGKVQTE